MKELVTIEAICTRYQCERHHAASIIRKIPHMKIGNRLMAYERDLDDWEREQMVYPLPKGGRTRKQQTPFLIPRRKAE